MICRSISGRADRRRRTAPAIPVCRYPCPAPRRGGYRPDCGSGKEPQQSGDPGRRRGADIFGVALPQEPMQVIDFIARQIAVPSRRLLMNGSASSAGTPPSAVAGFRPPFAKETPALQAATRCWAPGRTRCGLTIGDGFLRQRQQRAWAPRTPAQQSMRLRSLSARAKRRLR